MTVITPAAGTQLWRPYDDPPLLTPDMAAGPAATPPEDAAQLGRYLAALVAARRCPVHVSVAFNAVYFGYDVHEGGYLGGPLDLETFPTVSLGEAADALPVGAMVNVATGAILMPAEIVYKEGAHPQLGEDGEVPGWLSGAPSGACGPGRTDPLAQAVLHERLVIDPDAFGEGLSADATQLARMRRKSRWLDARGHLVVDAQYASAAEADLDDTDYYAHFLLTRGRDLILSPHAPAPLPTLLPPAADEDALATALHGLLDTVRGVLRGIDELRMRGDYAFTRVSLAERLADDGPLGGQALEDKATSISRTGVPSQRRNRAPARTVGHTALGPALLAMRDTSGLLDGIAYPIAICHANAVLADYVRCDSDEDTGLLRNGVHLRLDDPWQGGGIWRAEHPRTAPADRAPDEPLGLGWQDSLPPHAAQPVPEPEPVSPEPATGPVEEHEQGERPDWAPDDEDLGLGSLPALNDSQLDWIQTLRLWHTIQDVLPLPNAVAEGLRDAGWEGRTLRLELDHAGEPLAADDRAFGVTLERDDNGIRLAGVVWPLEFFPGIVLTLSWARAGGVIRARTTLLPEPVVIDGEDIRHRYDPQVLTRDQAPGNARKGTRGTNELTPGQQLLRAVRILGLLDQYGRAMLPEVHLAEALRRTTPDGHGVLTQLEAEGAIGLLVAAGELSVERGSLGEDGRAQHPARAGQPGIQLLCYTPRRAQRFVESPVMAVSSTDRLQPRGHRVHGHLRRIGHLGRQPSDKQRAAYREDMRRWGLVGSLEIPRGYTYIPDHHRGG
ncbi:hypothetical protein ABZ137_03360 [Streptomyces bobili]|uniref:hypothetical protein n=1 Tax=Streptomyces bobili TaxID=67280 RepID=UPI0033AAD6B1